MTRWLAAACALAACSGRSAPTGDTPGDHIAAAAAAPSGMRVDHVPGTHPGDAAAIELATLALQLDDAEQALQAATAAGAPADRIAPLQRKIAELRERQYAVETKLRGTDGMARVLAEPPRPTAR